MGLLSNHRRSKSGARDAPAPRRSGTVSILRNAGTTRVAQGLPMSNQSTIPLSLRTPGNWLLTRHTIDGRAVASISDFLTTATRHSGAFPAIRDGP